MVIYMLVVHVSQDKLLLTIGQVIEIIITAKCNKVNASVSGVSF